MRAPPQMRLETVVSTGDDQGASWSSNPVANASVSNGNGAAAPRTPLGATAPPPASAPAPIEEDL